MPSQITVDALGNVYVADAGLGKVLMYAAGSTATSTPVSIGTGLVALSGVAVMEQGTSLSPTAERLRSAFGLSGFKVAGQTPL